MHQSYVICKLQDFVTLHVNGYATIDREGTQYNHVVFLIFIIFRESLS